MLKEYVPIVLFLFISLGLGVVLLLIGNLITRAHPTPDKVAPYECGFDAFEDARMPFDVRFYLVAILFIIFDLETAFLFPWAVVFKDLSYVGVLSMAIFLFLLIVGFIYEWYKGALEWE